MSICDRCIHDEVCGLEANHEEAMTFCADMKPKDVVDKIRAEIEQITDTMRVSYNQYVSKIDVLKIIDRYKADRAIMEQMLDVKPIFRKIGGGR